jgi:hypothetical protein
MWFFLIFGGSLAALGGFFKIIAVLMSARSGHKHIALNISKAPGSNLLVLVAYFYSPKIMEEVFKPLIADWRTEYFDALNEGKSTKAKWISVRYIFSFGMAMGLSKVLSVIRSVAHR